MRTVGNVIWLIVGGLELALGYFLAGIVMFVLIVTIPFGIQAFKLGVFALWPFGRALIKREDADGVPFLGNLIWVVLAGWWLALVHLVFAVLYFISIIGIPFGIANVKLAKAALWPFGRDILPESTIDLGADGIIVSPRRALPPPPA